MNWFGVVQSTAPTVGFLIRRISRRWGNVSDCGRRLLADTAPIRNLRMARVVDSDCHQKMRVM